MLGQDRRWLPTWRTRLLYRFAAAASSSASSGLWLHGFSTYTSLPAARARMAAGACQWSGAAMTTASTSFRSSTRLKSFSAFAGRA
jgi:hypothetical protein